MNPFIPFIRIIIALLVYFGFAISASFLIKKFGADIKNMEGRTSSFVLYVGLLANLAVLVCILLLLKYVDGRDLSALGLVFTEKDLWFSITSSVLLILSAVSYLFLLKTKETIKRISARKIYSGIFIFER